MIDRSSVTNIVSPLTGVSNVKICDYVIADDIIIGYKRALDIDVSRFFKDNERVAIVECIDTKVRFFYPPLVEGDAKFYEDLAKINWYYQDWKWEYKIASKLIKSDDFVLEIGCGYGAFLSKIKNHVKFCMGLELNSNAAVFAEKKGVKVENVLIQDFAQVNKSRFDLVCSFQVLEHISDVRSFLEASLEILKDGGRMIVAVPNNNALFFKYKEDLISQYELQQRTLMMNMPPHHMILWNKKSLKNIEKNFPVKAKRVFEEPLPRFRFDMFNEIAMKRYLGKIYHPETDMLSKVIRALTSKVNRYILGDTVLVEYEKTM